MKIMLFALLLTLAACGSESDPGAEAEDRETVFDPLVSNIDKAKEVEGQVMEQKRQMDEELRKIEEGPE